VAGDQLALWKEQIDFKRSAQRDFLRLPHEVREIFFQAFVEFSKHPQMPTATLDVAPIRNDPSHWRLKVEGGYRGVCKIVHGRPKFEMFQSRQDMYAALRRYLTSNE
jgi:mRNA-degrading endonuclease RelE of RelBE toxin-antitoxin system